MKKESDFDKLDLDKVRRLAELGHTDHFMADFFGVKYEAWMYWKKAYPAFFEVLKSWKDHADARVERSMYEAAVGYEHEEQKIFCNKDGYVTKVTTRKKYPPDVKAAIFWLKNRKPEEWKDKTEIETNGTMDLASAILKARQRSGVEQKPEPEQEKPKADPKAMEFLE